MVELAAVMHEEARRTRELVGLTRENAHSQALVREVGAWELEALRQFRLVDVDR
jgi:hypothetical protein